MIRRHPFVTTVITIPVVVALSLATLVSLWLAGVTIPGASAARWFTITKTANADYTPAPDKPVFILVIGNDGRTGDTVTRGDAIHLIGVNPQLHQATMLDLPRDTGLSIPGHGVDKVNASHAFGGPRLEADTISAAVGVPIPYVVDTNFDGFIGMVDDMGGLTVNVPYRMQDSFSGADFQPGVQKLNGHQALSYARNRHQFPNSDLTRTQNQGYLILQALTQFRAENTGPLRTLELLADLGRHAQLDGIGLKDLYALGRLSLSIDPNQVKNVLVPVVSGSGSMLQLGPGATDLFHDFADDGVLQTH
ncbi:MAG: LCP family protein [Acidimicrobiia bacterium]